MKSFLLASSLTFFSLACCYQAKAQAGGGFAGIQVGAYKPDKKKKKRERRGPGEHSFSYSWEKGRTVKVIGRWSVGADLTFQKNTFEYAPDYGKLIGVYRAAIPLYANYEVDDRRSFECGLYVGALCHSNDVFATEFVRLSQREHLSVVPDYGLVAGMSWELRDLGKMKLRYNYGLNPVYPVAYGVTGRNQFVEVGFVIGF